MKARKRDKHENETVPPSPWGDCRPSGLSHSFFSVTIVFGRIFVVLLYSRPQIYKFIERKLDWKKVGSLGWSRMLGSLEIRAEFPLGCSQTCKKQQAIVEESAPK
jgi:hypothetical protein